MERAPRGGESLGALKEERSMASKENETTISTDIIQLII